MQEDEGVHQPRSKAQLLPWRPPEASTLSTVLSQLELLLGLFADQLGLLQKVGKVVRAHSTTFTPQMADLALPPCP